MTEWQAIVTGEFSDWFVRLDVAAQDAVSERVEVLRMVGPQLGRPYADTLKGSRHSNMKELIVPHEVIRVMFAFDPQRRAILLCGGSKSGDKRFYQRMIDRADFLFDEHLREGD